MSCKHLTLSSALALGNMQMLYPDELYTFCNVQLQASAVQPPAQGPPQAARVRQPLLEGQETAHVGFLGRSI